MKLLIYVSIGMFFVVGLVWIFNTGGNHGAKAKKVANKVESKLVIFESKADNSIYQYVDKDGNLVLTNKRIASAKKVDLPPLAVYAAPMTKNDLYSGGYTTHFGNDESSIIQGAYVGLNKNSPQLISGINDYGRRQILIEELGKEETALAKSLKLLNQARSMRFAGESDEFYQDRLKMLSDSVVEHQKNISLLNQSLNIR